MNKELMENLLSAVTNIAEILSKALEEDTPSSPEAVAVGITTHRPKRLLTKSELANLYTVSEKTIERWVKDGCSHQNIGTSEAQIYRFDPEKVDLFFESKAGKIQIIENGTAVDYSEAEATKILSETEVTAIADVKMGDKTATAWGCDLTHGYIDINADYRS